MLLPMKKNVSGQLLVVWKLGGKKEEEKKKDTNYFNQFVSEVMFKAGTTDWLSSQFV